MILSRFGVDRAITYTVLNRAWGVAAGPATLLFIVAYLTPTEQGFYYAFTSVLGLQVFFELGLGFVIMQTVSHLMPAVVVRESTLSGDELARQRIGRLLADVLRWYGIVCAAFIGLVLVAGGWFLGRSATNGSVAWHEAWMLVVPVFGLSILANACFSFLEGMGLVADVALARLLQAVLSMLGLWLMFVLGFKLMALVAFHTINLLIASAWILWRHGSLLRGIVSQRGRPGAIAWRQEIWPFQWRIAASWMAGYCGTQAITLILFARLGPIEAGRFGLSLTALGAVATGATAWLTTKAPRFGGLVAQSRHAELDTLYGGALRGALAFGTLGVLALLSLVSVLDLLHVSLAQRFVPLIGLVAMAAATLVTIKVSAQATYLRAFRREPYLVLSIITGAAQVATATLLTRFDSVNAVAIGYATVTLLIGLLWAHTLFSRLRREYARP